ncbi:MAG: RsbRD N-terminal domain-containing protein [Desulfobacterales bacterium]|nr:RsbRD N-terminal domain-containing protein [Desulfobacterales bacterium]MBU8911777.1 RsbRD N-terminal domain-containing protein [Desulfobacterales bacterium]
MSLKQILKKNKSAFIKQWFRATIDTYPVQSAKVLGKDSNRFDNPVGAATRETIEDVFDLIIEDFNQEMLEKALDPVIRIRAVQAFCASEAVSFVFALKKIGENILDDNLIREFDKLVDEIALAAFNKLMKCKEEIFLLKATESKRRIHRAFERAGLVTELSEEDLIGSKKS